jgi:hypothetical protein
MKQTILVAGGTGNLGERIIKAFDGSLSYLSTVLG